MTDLEPDIVAALGVADAVQHVLDDFFDQQGQNFDLIAPELAALVEAARAATGSGKRLRPAFCYWAFRACGGDPTMPIMQVASALELLHAAALVHDDIIDAAQTRRGAPSAHRRFAALARRWRPGEDTSDFGSSAALLLGDLLLMWADELLSSCPVDAGTLRRARAWLDVMRSEVVAGAFLELLAQVRRDADIGTAMLVLRYKSAKYTVQRPLQIGAALAGAAPPQLAALGAFGVVAGECFQLRDDMLGIFGDPSLVGKPIGIDLQDGKCPLLVACAREAGGAAIAHEIDMLRALSALSPAQLTRLRTILIDTGAVAICEQMICERLAHARESLAQAYFADDNAVAMLNALAFDCGRRST